MATCFIFIKYLQDAGCLITRFNDQGASDLEARHYSFAEIREFQKGYRTLLVCPCERVSLLDVELPWLAERKARAAIPFALEDRLTQSIEDLHFAFDKEHYLNGHYEIAVLEKQQLQNLMGIFTEEAIEFDAITLDWYALSADESILTGSSTLINSPDFKGALSPELASAFQSLFTRTHNFVFQDSSSEIEIPDKQLLPENSWIWISRRLLESKPLNLCQGELQHATHALQIQKGYRYLAGFAGLWLIMLLAFNAFKLHMVNSKLEDTNQQIAVIYKQFFPEAKQIINPKFRINQLLGDSAGNAQSSFWNLLDKLAQGIANSNVKIEQFRFQNKTLVATLVCPDFANLEKLEERLKQLQLKVTQTQAANRDQQVVATLELK